MIVNDPIQFWEPLLKVIRSAEASPDGTLPGTTQYDSVVSTKPLARLDTLSIQEAIQLVEKERPKSSFIGAYQFNKNNLIGGDNWVASAGLKPTDLFNKKNQDTIAIWLISSPSRRDGINWLNGNLITEDFMVKLAQEWAGLPVPYDLTNTKGRQIKVGQSYWRGTSTNRARATISSVMNALWVINPEKVELSDIDQPKIITSSSLKAVDIINNPVLSFIDIVKKTDSPFGSVSRDDFENIISEEQYIRLNTE